MNRDQARNLIENTFTRAFDKTSFRTFAVNVLNHIDESKAQAWSTQYVKDAFKPHVQRYERLGTYTSPNKETLDVLIVHLTNESKLERARTAIRNFVADHLKTRDEKDAALVAFVSPTEQQWRFSYVKMDYATVEKESGKIGVETRLTPARRFSYLVGEGESSHTAQSRFLGLLQDTQTDPQLSNIEEAFSVEAVTKEFFTKYAELFEQINKALTKLVEKDKAIRDEFKSKEVNTVDFAKKLMGQIVFLYFLQKKGWLGVEKGKEWGTGPRDFLRRLADEQYCKYDNFFNDVLEPLFYDTLATDRGHEAWDKRFKCRIPFLNGGLFEPLGDYNWKKTDIMLPNKLFTNNEFVEEGITGTGVLDVFDRYNFTVNEAEPLEKEVAIDPEMLGKVFENLIEENRRKGLGAFYTPREIVHYMCQESLINYLDTALNVVHTSSVSSTNEQDARATIFFDPNAPVDISQHNLPHWRQKGVTYFVTFRLADSLPQEKLRQLMSEREAWLKKHPEPRTPSAIAEYHRLFSAKVEEWLDAGAGSCVLKNPDASKIVADAMKYFDGERYKLGEWVVMPNHVHALVTPLDEHELSDILHSWKSFTANKINELLNRSGTLWQHESYDHIVRSEEQLRRIEQYIRDNPAKAGIKVAQASSLSGMVATHDQDGRATLVPREDIEVFVRLMEQYSFYEAAKQSGTIGRDYPKPPRSIEQNARLIDEKLAEITVCDPAVGSGAFPVGMMAEIVRARSALTSYFNDVHERTPYHFKRHAIQNCLYGVDIDAGAVEIAKLRLWLSLVVDEEETKQIKPLPNLDYKIVAGNSLIGFPFKSQRLSDIEKLKQQFFDETDHDKKANLKIQIDKQLHEAFAASKKSLGYEVNFDFEIYFSEVFSAKGGFDAVIANPPYIDSETMTKDSRQLRELIQASYSMTRGNWDIYIAFYEKGFRLLGNEGVLSFITPDKWISKPFGDEMRIKTTDKIFSILKAGRAVFESVNVDAIVSVFVKIPQPFLSIYDYTGTEIRLKRTIRKSTLKPPYAYDWLFSDFVELLAKIDAHCGKLTDLGVCENACATSDAYKLQEFIEEEPKRAKPDEHLRIINTGTIGKYVSKWGLREMVYLGGKYARPVVNKKQFLGAFRNSYGRKAVKQKLIMKGLNLLDACLDSDGNTIPGKTTLMITSDHSEALNLLLAIVNSSVPFFYIKEKYPASSYNQGTTFTKEMINDLPIPKIASNDRAKLVTLVDRILAAKKRDPGADTTPLEREIDRLVYELYELTPEEIEIVEGGKKS